METRGEKIMLSYFRKSLIFFSVRIKLIHCLVGVVNGIPGSTLYLISSIAIHSTTCGYVGRHQPVCDTLESKDSSYSNGHSKSSSRV